MRERVRSDWTPWHGGGNGHWQPPLEKRASTARKKPFRGAKPGIWNARSWACIPRKASFKTAGAVTTAGLTVCKTQSQERSTGRTKCQENAAPIHAACYSAMKSRHRNHENMPLVATRSDPEGSYTKGTQRRKKKIWYPIQATISKYMKWLI